jgi:hypothetical protein
MKIDRWRASPGSNLPNADRPDLALAGGAGCTGAGARTSSPPPRASFEALVDACARTLGVSLPGPHSSCAKRQ